MKMSRVVLFFCVLWMSGIGKTELCNSTLSTLHFTHGKKQLNITNCETYDAELQMDSDCAKDEEVDAKSQGLVAELVRIKARSIYDEGRHVVLSIAPNPSLILTNMKIYQMEGRTLRCFSLILHHRSSSEGNVEWPSLVALIPEDSFVHIQMDVRAKTNSIFYHQTLHFPSPLPGNCPQYFEETCPLSRFVYTDSTTNPYQDTLHIAQSEATEDLVYSLHLRTNENTTKLVKNFTDASERAMALPASKSKLYLITAAPRIYLQHNLKENYTAAVSSLVVVGMAIAIGLILWYNSIPRVKTLVIVYCRCDQHKLSANALQKLLCFLEKHCLVRVEAPSMSYNDLIDGQLDDDVLLGSKTKLPDIVIFVPFPTVSDHERSFEGETHQICSRYQNVRKKIELMLPLEESHKGWCPRSEWPRDTFKDFQLLQELPQFIRYVHPCYYPPFFERFFRRQLWGPQLQLTLNNSTYTNDHIREITDPKLNAKPDLSMRSEVTSTLFDLDAIV